MAQRREDTRSTKATARLAGLLYLLSGLPGVFSYIYVPAALIVPGDATATARKIADAALTYRLGILSDLVGQIILIFLVLSLYDLLKDVDRRYARLMVTLVVVGVTVQIVNVFNLIAPLILLSDAPFLSVFTTRQLNALALAFLTLRGSALFVSQVFWGFWLLPFGVLVIKSRFFPNILGWLLVVACLAYLAASVSFIVLPTHARLVIRGAQLLGGIGEGATLIWLLVMGARVPGPESVPSPAS